MYGNVLIVSDTPRRIYPWLKSTISRHKISTLIHLGDLADDIKLEIAPHKRWIYTDALKTLKHILEGLHVIIVAGNHDDNELIQEILGIAPLPSGSRIEINGRHLLLYHIPPETPPPLEGNELLLYGHTPEKLPGDKSLNVLTNPYILLPGGTIVRINYPAGTNRERKLHLRGG